MRLSSSEIQIIKDTVNFMDDQAQVYLFGSRTDDAKRGGDIDLLIMSPELKQGDAMKIRGKLWDKLGEQKIDIVIAKDNSHPFTRMALKEGVKL